MANSKEKSSKQKVEADNQQEKDVPAFVKKQMSKLNSSAKINLDNKIGEVVDVEECDLDKISEVYNIEDNGEVFKAGSKIRLLKIVSRK